ncbi:helix-turn-helix domain-containing protein [uncultured Sphingomonas sp.]|uniref:helix-turn-helix domain-containing protein n=1 Tax=uncultured Sphingomonas sp. TaxID=158754 RepID=UPI0025D02A6C|nr:helix-turn-helix domain-containing protein [uncultured Sphingomonas sp.]
MIDRERVLGLLDEHGWTQATLARACDVTPSAIQQILSGKTKNTRLAPTIARVLGVSQDYITGHSPDRYSAVSGDISPDELANILKNKLFGYDRGFTKRIYDDSDLNDALFNKVYDPYWIRRQVARVSPELFIENGPDYTPPLMSEAIGTDAMSPTLIKGDHVLISAASRTVDGDHGIWAISYGGLPMIRRLMPLPHDRGYRVSADNPAAPTFEAPKADIELIGIVFWIGRMLS